MGRGAALCRVPTSTSAGWKEKGPEPQQREVCIAKLRGHAFRSVLPGIVSHVTAAGACVKHGRCALGKRKA